MQPNFSTAISTGETGTRVYLRGELDVQSSPALDEVLGRALAAGLPIVIDCAGLSYCDSFGIRSVLMAGLRARARGCRAQHRELR